MADQAAKLLARAHLAEPVALGPLLNLRLGFNTGVTFGLFAGAGDLSRWTLVAATGAVALWLGGWMWREARLAVAIPLALIVGGASGNILDRVRAGAVTDFIDAHIGSAHWPTFNLADSAIVLGAAWLILASAWRRAPATSRAALRSNQHRR
ncbi:signal peptidase II [Phenylobacterium aquaticum]|nr:signal peptidase II [Phenylobacterium aquaticum]MCI3130783.1 signal peptidase II [Phenylobacterium aquaticum]